MKAFKKFSIVLTIFSLVALTVAAQQNVPEGFTAGSITLNNGTTLNGFVKEHFRKKASVGFIASADAKKKNYDGWELLSAKINNQEYVCVKGDFFTILAAGELSFLQKQTSAESKISYNGSDPVLIGTTDGKPGDYYLYNSKTLAINLVNKSSYDNVIHTAMGTYQPAVDKAKETREDVTRLKTAVELYNQRPTR